jgi:outer membrane protein assembly factor BamB
VAWKTKLGPTIWGQGLGSARGLVLVGEYELWALRASDGVVMWHYGGPDGGAGLSDPTMAGDTAFFGSGFGWAGALNAATGAPYWTVNIGERAFRPPVTADLVIYGTRGFLGGPQKGPLGAGHVIALHRSDGSEAWRFTLPDSAGYPGSGGAVSGGAVWQDRVIVGSYASRMYALRLTDGAKLWEHVGGDPHLAPYEQKPVVLGTTLVTGRVDNRVEGLDVTTGDTLWTIGGVDAMGDPVVAHDMVYLSVGPLLITTAAGRVLWRWGGTADGDLSFSGAPSVDDAGNIYVWGTKTATNYSSAFAVVPPIKP